jgi:adenosine kinase
MHVLVTGTLGYDYIMNFPGCFADRIMPEKIHKLSLSFLVNKLNKQFGGTAGNIAYTLRLLGIDPLLAAPAGNDFDIYGKFLIKHGISVEHIPVYKNVSTSSYFVVTDKEDNQIGSFYLGASKHADKISIKNTAGKNSASLAVLAPTEPGAMKKYVRECREQKIPYLYDPAFQIGNFSAPDLREGIVGSAIFIGNDYEIALVEQKLGISHEELIMMVPVLVTTLGSKGSVIETRKESIYIKPAKPKNTTDPTGAGDAYRAGFLAGYVRGYDLSVCGQMGSVAAVYTVEKYGTVTHTFTKEEFIKRYRDNYGHPLRLA